MKPAAKIVGITLFMFSGILIPAAFAADQASPLPADSNAESVPAVQNSKNNAPAQSENFQGQGTSTQFLAEGPLQQAGQSEDILSDSAAVPEPPLVEHLSMEQPKENYLDADPAPVNKESLVKPLDYDSDRKVSSEESKDLENSESAEGEVSEELLDFPDWNVRLNSNSISVEEFPKS